MTRHHRFLLALTTAATLAGAGSALAETRTLTVGGYGGSFETLLKQDIIPAFEKAHDVRIAFVPGNSTENLARLQAQKNAQEMDVVILDDGPMYQADALGFCAPLKPLPMAGDIYDIAKIGPDTIGIGFVATGLVYNKDWFREKGWPAPTSWEDLKDPKFDQILSIPPISNTYGLHALVMAARLAGGGEKNIDPGFKSFEDDIAPQVLTFEPSSGKMSELFQSKEVALAVWGSGRAKAVADSGFPMGFVYPKEGAVALMLAACPVVNSDVPELSQEFIQYLLQPDVQVKLAIAQGAGPVNKKAVLPDDLAAIVPYRDSISKLVKVDWDTINQHRDEWTTRWSREVEK
ncbi:ABC transporter substrate-binding protein [Paenirhodobacter enshiensis]|uniref:ABC transporter substrate-binding protein n=1 Tax=Paenirhodobacter enshiensis TaxID=1105367 RepID=UPI003FA30BC1